jgi:hypothetical protein
MKIDRDYKRAIEDAARPYDVTLEYAQGGKHPYVVIKAPNGEHRKTAFPSSPSCSFGARKKGADVRRLLMRMGAPLKTQPEQIGNLGQVLLESFKNQHPEPELPFMQPEAKLIRNGKDVPDVKPINIVKPDEPKFAKLTKDESIQLTRLLAMNSVMAGDVVTFNDGWDDARLHKILSTVPGRNKIALIAITNFRREHFGFTQAEVEERARRNQPTAYLTKGLKAELSSFDSRLAAMDRKLADMQATIDQLRKDMWA